MRAFFLGAVFLLIAWSQALAQKTITIPLADIGTGERYLRECPRVHPNMPFEEVTKTNYCFGYLRGVIDFHAVLHVYPGLNLFCPAKEVGNIEADRMLRDFMDKHPEHRDMPTSALLGKALSEQYPCPAASPSQPPK
jgi:hypothetical protein